MRRSYFGQACDQRPCSNSISGIAIERDRAIETCDRLREATSIPEDDAAAELGLREIGPDRERAGIARQRLVAAAESRQRIAAVQMDLGKIGICGQDRKSVV